MTDDELRLALSEFADGKEQIFSITDDTINAELAKRFPLIDVGTTQNTKKKRAGMFLIGDIPTCEMCGSELNHSHSWRRKNTTEERCTTYWNWSRTCSASCNQKLIEKRGNRKATFLEKFGETNPMKNKDIAADAMVKRGKPNGKKISITQKRNALLSAGVSQDILSKFDFDKNSSNDANVLVEIGNALSISLGREANRFDLAEYTKIPRIEVNRILRRGGDTASLFLGNKETKAILELLEFLYSIGINKADISIKNRKEIAPYEIDIFVSSHNIGIEYNGIWCHSEDYAGKDRNYHAMKVDLCENNNIRLFTIRDIEWDDPTKREVWKSILGRAFGKIQRKIYARKTKVVILDKNPIQFLNEHHLSGTAKASQFYALMYDNEIVQVCTLGKSRFTENELEIIRIATSKNTIVVGGVGKLLSAVFERNKDSNIVCYADRSHSSKLSCAYGTFMRYVGETDPNYIWFSGNYKEIFTRYQTQKHKLPSILGDVFDPSLSEKENMFKAGFDRYWDCGNLKFVYLGNT